jgi:hypothetical protein
MYITYSLVNLIYLVDIKQGADAICNPQSTISDAELQRCHDHQKLEDCVDGLLVSSAMVRAMRALVIVILLLLLIDCGVLLGLLE